jgi:hypothetical protein
MRAKTNLQLAQTMAKAEETKERLLKELPLPTEPTYEIPKLPLRLADLSDDELMRLFVALTRWTDYFSVAMAVSEIDMTFAKTVLDKAEAIAMLKAFQAVTPKSDRSTTIAKAEAMSDPEVEHWQEAYDTAYAKKKLTVVYYEAAERDAAVASRELTRRVGKRENNERRTARWTP